MNSDYVNIFDTLLNQHSQNKDKINKIDLNIGLPLLKPNAERIKIQTIAVETMFAH